MLRLRLTITFGLLALLLWTQQASYRPGWARSGLQTVAQSTGLVNPAAQRPAGSSNTVTRRAWCPSWLSAAACPDGMALVTSEQSGEQPGAATNSAAREKAR
jgi:hypothetical protein